MAATFSERVLLGSLIADAFSMPVHWYYNTAALDRDYPELSTTEVYLSPKKSHPDSILWRSVYQPLNAEANILHDQARYWGQRDVHYHQFLKAGRNTVNYQLAYELYQQVTDSGKYDAEDWLQHYVKCMRLPGWHQDTYVEEYHRAFFNRRAAGRKLLKCGIEDIHIGGLSQVPALFAALLLIGVSDLAELRQVTRCHIELTHKSREVIDAGDLLVRLLHGLRQGNELELLLESEANGVISLNQFRKWSEKPDRQVIGRIMSPACYIYDSFPAALYLSWKYRHDFMEGIRANALVGGDNCHRGAVVGSLLGALHPVPDSWIKGLELRQSHFFAKASNSDIL